MADTFGIFREVSVPVLQGAPKELPSFKGKAQVLNIPKKALSDVSNTVSLKTQNMRTNDAPGKSVAESCSKFQQPTAVSCKPVAEVVEESPAGNIDSHDSLHCNSWNSLDWDYDILPKSQRLSEEALNIFTSMPPYNAKSTPCYNIPEFSLVNFPVFEIDIQEMPLGNLSLEDIPVPESDVSF